jgi:hypothetical protein
MALIFSLSAECGLSHQDAETFRDHFQNLLLTLADGKEVRCSSSRCFQNCDRNWWTIVIPDGMIIGGKDTDLTLVQKERASEVGFLLYDHLKSAPFFRYAMVGLEVDGFVEESEFQTTDLQRYDGVVLSKEFYERIDCQNGFEKFTADYYWRPYLGEKQDL